MSERYDIYIKNRKGEWEEFIAKLTSWEEVMSRIDFFGSRQRYKYRLFRIYKRERKGSIFVNRLEVEGIPETIINHQIKENNNVCDETQKKHTKN